MRAQGRRDRLRWSWVSLTLLVCGCSNGSGSPNDAPDDAGGPGDAAAPTDDAGLPPEPDCPFDYDAYTPSSTPTLSEDIFPILQQNCNLLSCHGTSELSIPQADLSLGPLFVEGPPTREELDAVHSELLAESVTVPGMKRVEPGDPKNSLLMMKLDGCHDQRGLECTRQSGSFALSPCGDRMPQSQPPLSEDARNVIRDWILTGAASD